MMYKVITKTTRDYTQKTHHKNAGFMDAQKSSACNLPSAINTSQRPLHACFSELDKLLPYAGWPCSVPRGTSSTGSTDSTFSGTCHTPTRRSRPTSSTRAPPLPSCRAVRSKTCGPLQNQLLYGSSYMCSSMRRGIISSKLWWACWCWGLGHTPTHVYLYAHTPKHTHTKTHTAVAQQHHGHLPPPPHEPHHCYY